MIFVVGTYVSGTKWGVRLDIGGKMGLDGHWYEGVVAAGTLLLLNFSAKKMKEREKKREEINNLKILCNSKNTDKIS